MAAHVIKYDLIKKIPEDSKYFTSDIVEEKPSNTIVCPSIEHNNSETMDKKDIQKKCHAKETQSKSPQPHDTIDQEPKQQVSTSHKISTFS